ncbi:hypothetical protein ACFSJM_08825 [Lactococcus formosensis subsp. bovis]|uniref:hypothetical protein n=1 Tax=Lactococcus formosensis TaxID=1281486 RepID=UPI001BD15201|nr:hypothetical protein [Lactococcus formosensis]
MKTTKLENLRKQHRMTRNQLGAEINKISHRRCPEIVDKIQAHELRHRYMSLKDLSLIAFVFYCPINELEEKDD